jgi:predicted transcriptional regulator
MKILSIKVPEALAAQLDRAASAADRSLSDIVRPAIELYLFRENLPGSESFASKAVDLAGCLEGPEDLSIDPRHLEGYGT